MLNIQNKNHSILLVDDEAKWLKVLALTIRQKLEIKSIYACADSREAMSMIEKHSPSVVLLDITMPHLSGEALYEQIKQHDNALPVIFLTGRNEVALAVSCMRQGAFDYYLKTEEEERILSGICNALAFRELQTENQQLRARANAANLRYPEAFKSILTCDEKMVQVFRYIEAITTSNEPVLITGESGSGKEMIARAVHDTSRPNQPFVAVNVAGLEDNIFSDTLFGHVRGSYTGADQPRAGMIEKAGSGTLFLDEMGDLSLSSQVKLLRMLQEKEYYPLGCDVTKPVRARIVCATNRKLSARIVKGQFREDLYYRLNAHHIELPPLRERKEDIELLLNHFIHQSSAAQNKTVQNVEKEVLETLRRYPFPGNIRELNALVHDLVSLTVEGPVTYNSLSDKLKHSALDEPCDKNSNNEPSTLNFGDNLPSMQDVGNLLAQEALLRCSGNQSRAAEMIGISRQAIAKRIKKLP